MANSKYKNYTDEDCLYLAREVNKGRKLKDIADDMGRSKAAIYKLIEKKGGRSVFLDDPTRKSIATCDRICYQYSDEERVVIEDLRSQGVAIREIALQIGRSVYGVYNFCKREGIGLTTVSLKDTFKEQTKSIDERIDVIEEQIKLIFELLEEQ